jgi:hypothetical protein
MRILESLVSDWQTMITDATERLRSMITDASERLR